MLIEHATRLLTKYYTIEKQLFIFLAVVFGLMHSFKLCHSFFHLFNLKKTMLETQQKLTYNWKRLHNLIKVKKSTYLHPQLIIVKVN